MSDHDRKRDREEPFIIGSVGELLRPATRRKFFRMMGTSGAIVLLPSVFAGCDDDDDGPSGNERPQPVTAVTFDLRTDVGIFRLVHVLEIVEGAFYTAVVNKSDFTTIFNADAQEVLRDIRNAEVIHREFVRTALGAQAVPDFSSQLNQTTLAAALSSAASILTTARMLESLGVSGLNGGGKYIKDVRNLLVAGKVASVEARHLAALRELQPPAGVDANLAFASDETIDPNGRDIKQEAGEILARVKAMDIISEPLETNITISNPPDASQGVPTPSFFPPTP
ncbi:MAG: ferritin-like domain-containing protein [Gemmatimonadaceae bacterium]|nr:ferritin-like domain-containing protein [Gemmatimonadaceae bacterium]MDQ3134977.1 ferritin-like domain-containing protein [Acidobacteriota bacterium]